MHELSVTESIVRKIIEIKDEQNIQKVLTIYLKIGRLSGFEKEAIHTCFELLKKNSPLENSQLQLIDVPIRLHCKSCQHESILSELNHQCSNCLSFETELISGREFLIDSLDVE